MSGNDVRDRIKGYFESVGVNTIVTKKNYNAEDVESNSDVVKTVYEIMLDRMVSAPSTSSMQINKGTSKSEFNLEANV